MKVFEFYFNPKIKPDLIFDSFCYEPENIYEKRLGSLYMLGLLKNALPKNLQFLEKLSKFIRERYFKKTLSKPEKALKETLKEANEYLGEIAKRGDVSWLGNLSFAILNLKNFVLNFTKVGEIKICLLRGGKIIDIDKKLKLQDIEPYPLKIFGNVVSGKLIENDLVFVFTKEIFDFFSKENLLAEIAKLSYFSEKELKEILDKKKELITKISGIFLMIFLTKREIAGKKEIISPKISKEFSLKEVFAPLFSPILKKFKKPKIKFPVISLKEKLKSLFFNKKVILVLALILILLFGFILAKTEKEKRIKIYQRNLKGIEENLNLAESYLILEKPETFQKANSLLKNSFEKISPILKEGDLPKDLANQVSILKDKILEKLYNLNKLEKIEEPELVFEFKVGEFIPQRMIAFGNNLYFFNPYSKNLFILKENGEKEIIEIGQKINLAASFEDSILFFSRPAQITIYPGLTSVNLKEPYPDFNFDDFSAFKGNLYFLDKKAGQIIKYPYLGNFNWGEPELWLKRATMGKSMAIDGTIWVLERDNSIGKYYNGKLKEKLEIDIFPSQKDFSKIFTSPDLPYLFILEPQQKRIIILKKNGQIFKQFQSEKFDNLLDFSISKDGKEIWILNGMKVYQIKI